MLATRVWDVGVPSRLTCPLHPKSIPGSLKEAVAGRGRGDQDDVWLCKSIFLEASCLPWIVLDSSIRKAPGASTQRAGASRGDSWGVGDLCWAPGWHCFPVTDAQLFQNLWRASPPLDR